MAAVTSSGQTDAVFGSWLYHSKWKGNVLTYAFPDSPADFGYTSSASLRQLTGGQINAAERALAQVESFTGMRFDASASHGGATLRFVRDTAQSTAVAYLPYPGEEGGDGFFGDATLAPEMGNYADFTFRHELGHMLGLEHGHTAAGFGGSDQDSTEFTVMTYSAYPGDRSDTLNIGAADYAQSYMQLDIAALQFLYGANFDQTGQAWSGNSRYRFDPDTGEMSINGVGQGVPAGNRIFRTIWDGDGEDTYDLANYDTRLTIDLQPGAWSVFAQNQIADLDVGSGDPGREARGNIANALLFEGDRRSLIENAIGGSRQDHITGNLADNRLEGRSGRDIIDGGAGDDWIHGGRDDDVLRGSAGADLLLGAQGNDRLIGGNGNDRLKGHAGDDDLRGGGGADMMLGGGGKDLMRGQGGPDRFVFLSVSDSRVGTPSDRILDFAPGQDVIDMRRVANGLELEIGKALQPGGPTVGTREMNGNTVVSVDADGDGLADMRVILLRALDLGEGDFLL